MVYHVVEPSDQLSGLALIILSPQRKAGAPTTTTK